MEMAANSEQGELVGVVRSGEASQEGAQCGGGRPTGEQDGGVLVWSGCEAGGEADGLGQRAGGDPNNQREPGCLIVAGYCQKGIGDHQVGVLLRQPVKQSGARQGGIGRDRNTTRAALGPSLSVSAFPLYVPV